MIVRIPSEGQYNLPGAFIDDLNDVDNKLVEAVELEDEPQFEKLLKEMLDLVRNNGTLLPLSLIHISEPTRPY